MQSKKKVFINGERHFVSGKTDIAKINTDIQAKKEETTKQNDSKKLHLIRRTTNPKNEIPIKQISPIPLEKKQSVDPLKHIPKKTFNVLDRSNKTSEPNENVSNLTIRKPILKPNNKLPTKNITSKSSDKSTEDKPTEKIIPESTDTMENITDQDDHYSNKFDVTPNQWHVLAVKLKDPTKNGIVKILDNFKKQLLPIIKLPNTLFLTTTKKDEDLTKPHEFRIYFKTFTSTKSVRVVSMGISFSFIRVQSVTLEIVKKNADLWKFRRLFDLEFINYYLEKLSTKEVSIKFLDRFKSDYELFKNPNYFDTFLSNLKLDLEVSPPKSSDQNIILYLTYSSIEYEDYGYTIRTQYLLKNTNLVDPKFNIINATKYGYPFEKDESYYGKNVDIKHEKDGVVTFKLLKDKDNYNTNNLVDYLKKYIVEVIKFANKMNVTIIHSTTNFWNGIACLYASKYLGIKSIYEVRGFWDDIADNKNSDYMQMINAMETKVMKEVNCVLTINESLRKKIVGDGIEEGKLVNIDNGVDTGVFVQNREVREKLRRELYFDEDDIVLGYIGSLSSFEGLEYLVSCVEKLKSNVKMLLVGSGTFKDTLLDMAKRLNLGNRLVYLGKLPFEKVVNYYNVIDIVVYPRKLNLLCKTTGSYKIYEAMSMAKPLVVSNLDPYLEVITDRENGLVFEHDNENALLGCLKELIGNPELRNDIGRKAREWVVENREWKKIGGNLIDVYKNLLKTNNDKCEHLCDV